VTSEARELDAAYGTSAKLRDRHDLYRYQEEPFDLYDLVLDQVELTDGLRLLDAGSGPGEAEARIRRRGSGAWVVALDRSPGMLAELGERHPGVPLVCGSIDGLPVRTGSIDVALAMHVLYHAPNVDRAVAELRRAVRAGGTLLASTLGERHLAEVLALYADVVGHPVTRASSRFSLDDPADLEAHFESVHLVRRTGAVVVDDPEPVVRFAKSACDFYQHELPLDRTWDDVVAHVHEVASDTIRHDGVLRLTTDVGVFVCE
jgi:SAM-dependent methyltransferase